VQKEENNNEICIGTRMTYCVLYLFRRTEIQEPYSLSADTAECCVSSNLTLSRFVSGTNDCVKIRSVVGRVGLLIWLGYHPKGATTATPKADVIDELCT
jgi:hypothetical protein